MNRIVIIGATGSGKSTLAREIAQITGAAYIELDDYFWQPGWRETPAKDFRNAVLAAVTGKERWITAGNYRAIQDITWAQADTLIWVDYAFPRTFIQLWTRSLKRAREQAPVCNGNSESYRRLFSRDSILLWFLRSFYRKRREYGTLFSERTAPPTIKTYIRLRNPRQTQEFLRTLTPR